MNLTPNPWLDFLDSDGWHLCQPDGVVVCEDRVVVLEVKLKECWQGYEELRCLYLPVAKAYWKLPVVGIQVCRTLQSKAHGWLFTGPSVDFSGMASDEIGTWLLRS